MRTKTLKRLRRVLTAALWISMVAAVISIGLTLVTGFLPDSPTAAIEGGILPTEGALDDSEVVDGLGGLEIVTNSQGTEFIGGVMWVEVDSYGPVLAGTLAASLLRWGSTIVIILALRHIVDSALGGRPFVAEHVRKIQTVAGAVWILTLLVPGVDYLTQIYTARQVAWDTWELVPDLKISLSLAFMAFVVLIVGQLYRAAVELQAEQDFTV